MSLVNNNDYKKLHTAASFIKKWCGGKVPAKLIILGTGLGNFPTCLRQTKKIPYTRIPHFPVSTVPGHAGVLWRGSIGNINLLVMQGRVHYYEGFSMEEVVFPVRTLIMAGIKSLIVTNAAGGISPSFNPGDIVLIKDHINLMGADPLLGFYDTRLGPRFVDMTEAYDFKLRQLAKREAKRLGIRFQEGVYAAVSGPSFETPALIRALKRLGADHVAMSLVPEVTAARQMNVRCLGLSLITNYAAGRIKQVLTHEEHLKTAATTSERFIQLLENIIKELP